MHNNEAMICVAVLKYQHATDSQRKSCLRNYRLEYYSVHFHEAHPLSPPHKHMQCYSHSGAGFKAAGNFMRYSAGAMQNYC